MTITVLDSRAAMATILNAPEPERTALLRRMWAPMAEMYHFVPGEVDLAQVYLQTFGFPLDGDTRRLRDGLEALTAADAWARIEAGARQAASAIETACPGIAMPDVKVLLVLGDPANQHFMHEIQGLSAFGGISGYIVLTLWPHPKVLERLEAIVAHELHHNVRYSPGGVVWNPATVTLGEQVVAEGLADVFATELHDDLGPTHFVGDATHRDDQTLARMASNLGRTGMQEFTAWIHGDASARLFGVEPVGMPTGAGYAVGARLARAYLEATNQTAAAAVQTPAADIIDIALDLLHLRHGASDWVN